MYSLATGTGGMPDLRAMSAEWFSFHGIAQQQAMEVLDSIQSYAKAPATEAWVYRCVALKASFNQGIPLRVYVKSGRDRVPVDDTNDGAAQDLQGLLDDVNPISMTGADLKAYSSAAMAVWGENYVRKVRGSRGFGVKELWWLRAPDITPKMGRVWIDSYDYKDRSGSTENYRTPDVIPWRTINLQDPTRGLSPLSSIRYAISVNRQASESAASILANWSVPPGAWIIPKDADFTKDDRSLVTRALRLLKGPRNQGKVPILPQGLEWKSIAMTPADMEAVHLRKLSRMEVCAALGVPLVLAGDDEKSSVYANLRDAERVFARSEIGGLDWVAEGWNSWLVPDFDPAPPGQRRLVVAYDYTGIEALQAPLEDRKRVALSEIEHGARTGNEYRAEFRTGDPLPNGEGDVVTRLATLQPIALGDAPATGPSSQPEPDQPDAGPALDVGSDTIRSYGRDLYKHPAVRAWLADSTRPLDTRLLVGYSATREQRDAIESGLRRRAAASTIADDLEGASAA